MKGLIIKYPWIDHILSGEKIWEIRGQNTKIRGEIALIKSGSGCVFGTVEIVDCIELTIDLYKLEKLKHMITIHMSRYYDFCRLFNKYGFTLEQQNICYYGFMKTELSYNGILTEGLQEDISVLKRLAYYFEKLYFNYPIENKKYIESKIIPYIKPNITT